MSKINDNNEYLDLDKPINDRSNTKSTKSTMQGTSKWGIFYIIILLLGIISGYAISKYLIDNQIITKKMAFITISGVVLWYVLYLNNGIIKFEQIGGAYEEDVDDVLGGNLLIGLFVFVIIYLLFAVYTVDWGDKDDETTLTLRDRFINDNIKGIPLSYYNKAQERFIKTRGKMASAYKKNL